VLESTVTLVADPRNPHSAADRTLKQQTDMRLYDDIERLGYVGDQLAALAAGARKQADKAPAALGKKLTAFADAADKQRGAFVAAGDGYIGGDEKLREHLGNLYGNVVNYEGRPGPAQLSRLDILEGQIVDVEKTFAGFVGKDVAAINSALTGAKLDALKVASKDEWKAKEQGAAGTSVALDDLSEESVERLLALYPWLPSVPQQLRSFR
jgi:hypothetical protein